MFQCSNKKIPRCSNPEKSCCPFFEPFKKSGKKAKTNRQKLVKFFFPAFLDSSTLEHLGQWLEGSSRYLISATQKTYPDWLNQTNKGNPPKKNKSWVTFACFGEGGKFICHLFLGIQWFLDHISIKTDRGTIAKAQSNSFRELLKSNRFDPTNSITDWTSNPEINFEFVLSPHIF